MKQEQEGHLIEFSNSLEPRSRDSVPSSIEQLGNHARFAWDEFFAIDNDNTKEAYKRAVSRFLEWCEHGNLPLTSVMPSDISKYIKELKNQKTSEAASKETKKLQLSAIRGFFDALVLPHAVVLNPGKASPGSATVLLLVNTDSEKDFRIPFWEVQRTWGPAPKPPRFLEAWRVVFDGTCCRLGVLGETEAGSGENQPAKG